MFVLVAPHCGLFYGISDLLHVVPSDVDEHSDLLLSVRWRSAFYAVLKILCLICCCIFNFAKF